MLTATSFKELEKIVGDLEEGRKIMEKLKELGLDDKYGALYDAEIVHKKEINSARNEGYSDGKKETARAMISKKMNLTLISELTGLSKKEIEKLV